MQLLFLATDFVTKARSGIMLYMELESFTLGMDAYSRALSTKSFEIHVVISRKMIKLLSLNRNKTT